MTAGDGPEAALAGAGLDLGVLAAFAEDVDMADLSGVDSANKKAAHRRGAQRDPSDDTVIAAAGAGGAYGVALAIG